MAAEFRLPVADKPDSQDICFIPAGNYREFVERRLTKRVPGVVRASDGSVLGRHDGVHGFTVGQRKGLPIAGGNGRPVYVTKINAHTGDVTVGHAEDLLQTELYASGVNWVSGEPPRGPVRAQARIRYNGSEDDATVTPLGEWAKITFERPMRAVTPGQAVVFFDGETVLGGGLIELEAPAGVERPLASLVVSRP
jgi:tRNA-specific 2-thiouridylase